MSVRLTSGYGKAYSISAPSPAWTDLGIGQFPFFSEEVVVGNANGISYHAVSFQDATFPRSWVVEEGPRIMSRLLSVFAKVFSERRPNVVHAEKGRRGKRGKMEKENPSWLSNFETEVNAL